MTKIIYLALFCLAFAGCVTKTVCKNQTENQRSIYDVDDSCRLRIRQVVIGSEVDMPKSIDFKSGTVWTYMWVESKFESGKFTGGHFVLSPVSDSSVAKDSNGK